MMPQDTEIAIAGHIAHPDAGVADWAMASELLPPSVPAYTHAKPDDEVVRAGLRG
jgi:hypothetical protein